MRSSLHLETMSIIPSVFEPDTYYIQSFKSDGAEDGKFVSLNKKQLLQLMTWIREELKPQIIVDNT